MILLRTAGNYATVNRHGDVTEQQKLANCVNSFRPKPLYFFEELANVFKITASTINLAIFNFIDKDEPDV